MEILHQLNREFLNQDFSRPESARDADELARCKLLVEDYARMENCLSVLSDLRSNRSHICYGGFARTLGLESGSGAVDEIDSVWEESILSRIHPEDLAAKYLQELRFFHFMKHQPGPSRSNYCLAQRLRMKDRFGNWLPTLHRLFYITSPHDNSLWLTLCLYNPLVLDLPHDAVVVHTATGRLQPLERRDDLRILSDREREVLRLIDGGMMSKAIAQRLSISVHTVSRHRQEILGKLQVRNSIEACRVAKDLGIL